MRELIERIDAALASGFHQQTRRAKMDWRAELFCGGVSPDFAKPAKAPSDDPKAVAKQSLSVDSAAHVRADRIVASKANPADKARERGFRDAVMGLPSRRHEFGKISQVSYDQGVDRAKKTRERLKGRPWMETEVERDGSKWRWAVYEEGKHIASGEARTEKAAGQAVDDARVRAAEKRDGTATVASYDEGV